MHLTRPQSNLNYHRCPNNDDNYSDVSLGSYETQETLANIHRSFTSTISAPADALYPNGGFEFGDLTEWTPYNYSNNYDNVNQFSTANVSIVSPGYNSNYAAYLTVNINTTASPSSNYYYYDTAVEIDEQNVTVVPNLTYTFSFDYKQDSNTTGTGNSQDTGLGFALYPSTNIEDDSGYEDGGSDYFYNTIYLNPGAQLDSLNNTPGVWNTFTMPSFVAVSSTYRLYFYLETYNSNDVNRQNYTSRMGVQVDNFQLLASLPNPPAIGSPYPSCASQYDIPRARYRGVETTNEDYVLRFPDMLIQSNNTAEVQANTTVESLSACQDELVSVGQELWSAQYDNSTGSCIVYNVSLCGQEALLYAGANSFAIQYGDAD